MIRHNHKRRPPKSSSKWKVSRRRWAQVGLVCGLAFLSMWVFEANGLIKYYTMTRELARMEQEMKDLEMANQSLAQEIERIKTDSFTLEKLARERLGYVRKGETVYQWAENP